MKIYRYTKENKCIGTKKVIFHDGILSRAPTNKLNIHLFNASFWLSYSSPVLYFLYF